jgi:hypothetical protein
VGEMAAKFSPPRTVIPSLSGLDSLPKVRRGSLSVWLSVCLSVFYACLLRPSPFCPHPLRTAGCRCFAPVPVCCSVRARLSLSLPLSLSVLALGGLALTAHFWRSARWRSVLSIVLHSPWSGVGCGCTGGWWAAVDQQGQAEPALQRERALGGKLGLPDGTECRVPRCVAVQLCTCAAVRARGSVAHTPLSPTCGV